MQIMNLKYILIIVILAAIVCGGILAYQYWWVPKQEGKAPEKEATGWKIYTNEKYGYEIKYPSNWLAKDEGGQEPDIVIFNDTEFWGELPIIYASISIRTAGVSEDSVIGWNKTVLSRPDKWEIVEIGGVQAVEEEYKYQHAVGSGKRYTFMHEKALVRYGILTEIKDVKNTPSPGGGVVPENIIDPNKTPELYREIFNQILSTFKFLE